MEGNVISPVNIKDRKKLGIKAGDTVRVWQKIKEGDKFRLQAFEGLVLSTKHGNESGASFTVRRTSSGVGIEKIFPLYSPMIDKIEILKRAKVRRAKLYHIREKAAREIRRQMRNMKIVDLSTASDIEEKEALEKTGETEEGPETPSDTRAKEDPKASDDARVKEEKEEASKEENKKGEAKGNEEKEEKSE